VCGASLKLGCGASMVSIAGFLFRAEPLRDERGTLSNGYGSSYRHRGPQAGGEALRESEKRFRDYAERPPTGSGDRPDHGVTAYRIISTPLASRPPSLTGLARWGLRGRCRTGSEKWRQHRAMHDAHQPFRRFRVQNCIQKSCYDPAAAAIVTRVISVSGHGYRILPAHNAALRSQRSSGYSFCTRKSRNG